MIKRPLISSKSLEQAMKLAQLSKTEEEIIAHIRFIGVFNQVNLRQALRLDSKPPVLSLLCEACRKIGEEIPEHFEAVRKWSEQNSEYSVRWDGNLICSLALNCDGELLNPESGTTQYHTFVVHKEFFLGLSS